jgi:IS1 family transposase/transposase-like protein
MSNKVNTNLPLFCPCPECESYQNPKNKITKDGVYKTKTDVQPRQMYKCHNGHHRFSETRYSDLFGKAGSFKEYEMAAKMSCHGLSSEAIAEILDRDIRTIQTWMRAIGKKSEKFHLFLCLTLGLNLLFLQMDEVWSFLTSKKQQLWGFIALESQQKFWISFELGSRTIFTANRLVKQVKCFGNWRPGQVLKVTTEKLAAYKNALAQHRGFLCLFTNCQVPFETPASHCKKRICYWKVTRLS